MTLGQEIAAHRERLGIHEFGFVPTEKIVASQMVRGLCEKNACGAYGKTWACPPGVGTLAECSARMRAYETVFVFTTRHELEDSLDWEGMVAGKKAHEAVTPRVVDFFRRRFPDCMVLASEGCPHCEKCTYPDAPCRFPEKLHPSIESYGVEVNVLARDAGVRYHNGPNTVTYFSCIFFTDSAQGGAARGQTTSMEGSL